MKNNKKFLAFALTGLALLGSYVGYESTYDHTEPRGCIASKALYYAGYENLAYQHQVNAINRQEGCRAKLVDQIIVYKTILNEDEHNRLQKDIVILNPDHFCWVDFDGNSGTLIDAYRDKHIETKRDGENFTRKIVIR